MEVVRVRLTFKDKQVSMHSGLQQFLMHTDGIAQKEITRAGKQDGGWKS
jgi:hypothetical protein